MGGLFGKSSTISNTETAIGSLQLQTSTYGGVIPVVFGTNLLAGNLLDYVDFTQIPHTTTTRSGGKGGGGTTQSDTSYTYTVAAIIGLAEGPIAGLGRAWESKNVYKINVLYPGAPDWLKNMTGTLIHTSGSLSTLNVTTFFGDASQQAWDYMVSKHPERALVYPKLAYVAASAWDLGSNASLKNYNFEMIGRNLSAGSLDANPKDIITAIMSDAQIGVGFPAEYIGDLTSYSNYCIANEVLFSPAYTSQEEAQALITNLCQASNVEPVWSQGSLKIVPYSLESVTANGVTYMPEQKEIPDLTPDDFVYEEGEPSVRIKPNLTADQYNIQPVEILNREHDYNVEPVKATDDPDIHVRGPRLADSIEMHFITTTNVGQFAAQSVLQRQLYVPNQYEFTLTWRHCLLDPMDVVTITEPDFLGLDKVPVRIVQIEEDDECNLKIIAEDCPEGIHSPALYPTQMATRPSVNYNMAPGDVNAPIVFELPDTLVTSGLGLEVGIGASGGDSWGGAGVWLSEDGDTYKRVGRITAPARQGITKTALPIGTDPDTTNTVAVDMTMSRSELISGTQQDANNLNTVCFLDGELIAYQMATLIEQYQYGLSYLRRGAYGTTITSHNTNTQFMRIDEAIFRYPFTEAQIGKTIYIKLTSFNIYGSAEQNLADVQAYTYTIKGSALYSELPDCQNLTSYYQSGRIWLKCDAVTDFRSVVYEWRLGSCWNTATVLGTTTDPSFMTVGDGTYWVAAKSGIAYSANAKSVIVEGSNIAENVIASFDEFATGLTGTLSSGAAITEYADKPAINLTGKGLFSTIPQVSELTSIVYYGGVASTGSYEIPESHIIDIGAAQYCNVTASYNARIASPLELFSQIPQVSKVVSFIGNYSQYGSVVIQIAIAGNDGVFGEWQNFTPAQYYGRKFKARAVLNSTDETVSAYLLGFVFSVDVPDRIETGTNVQVPTAGLSVTHEIPFHAIPNTQVTILNAQEGDTLILLNEIMSGFDAYITNAGTPVIRNVNWLRKGY